MDCADEVYHRNETYNRKHNVIEYRKDNYGWEAWAGDRVVGSIDRLQCQVMLLDVDAAHRLQGIGTTLLFLALEDMRAQGCEAATLRAGKIRSSDPHPQRFYEKQGFRVRFTIKDVSEMIKNL